MKSNRSPRLGERRPTGSTIGFAAASVILLGLGLLLSVSGSASAGGAESSDTESGCDQAFAQAMAIEPGSDTVQSVGGAVAECRSLEEWVAAAQQFPDAFGGADPMTTPREGCAASPDLTTSPICVELGGH